MLEALGWLPLKRWLPKSFKHRAILEWPGAHFRGKQSW